MASAPKTGKRLTLQKKSSTKLVAILAHNAVAARIQLDAGDRAYLFLSTDDGAPPVRLVELRKGGSPDTPADIICEATVPSGYIVNLSTRGEISRSNLDFYGSWLETFTAEGTETNCQFRLKLRFDGGANVSFSVWSTTIKKVSTPPTITIPWPQWRYYRFFSLTSSFSLPFFVGF